MSELNTAEMPREQLEAAATDLGISFQGNTKDDTLRKKIDEALGNPAPAAKASDSPKPSAKGKRYEVIIQSHERDKQPVQIGVNGRNYVIERGKKVVVPESVVKVLETAVRDVFDPRTMEKSEVLSYPFSAREV